MAFRRVLNSYKHSIYQRYSSLLKLYQSTLRE
jgi:hypothetical protein